MGIYWTLYYFKDTGVIVFRNTDYLHKLLNCIKDIRLPIISDTIYLIYNYNLCNLKERIIIF